MLISTLYQTLNISTCSSSRCTSPYGELFPETETEAEAEDEGNRNSDHGRDCEDSNTDTSKDKDAPGGLAAAGGAQAQPVVRKYNICENAGTAGSTVTSK